MEGQSADLTRIANCHTLSGVSPTHRYTFWIDDAQEAALKELIERPGEESAVSFHLRQAIREYLVRKGVTIKAERKRVAARKRP